MYEKEIEEIARALGEVGYFEESLNKAIALMRAAQPKDEAAERAYCVGQAEDWVRDWLPDPQPIPADLLLRERAAARVEGFAAGQAAPRPAGFSSQIEVLTHARDTWELRAQQAQAEAERLITQIENLKDDKAAMYAQAERNIAELRELRVENAALKHRLAGLEK
jgi:hypothetical protein